MPLTGVRSSTARACRSTIASPRTRSRNCCSPSGADPKLRTPIFDSLPVAGESGTLEDRLQYRPARGAVHAKTGTTDLATALSGYVRREYAFSLLNNGYPVSWTASRHAQDRFAMTLAKTPVTQETVSLKQFPEF